MVVRLLLLYRITDLSVVLFVSTSILRKSGFGHYHELYKPVNPYNQGGQPVLPVPKDFYSTGINLNM